MKTTATNIRQSEHLLKLGVNPDTADMCWTNHCYGSVRSSFSLSAKTADEYKELLGRFSDTQSIDAYIPAWSLTALMNMLPSIIRLNSHGYVLQIGKLADEKRWYVSYEWEGHIHEIFKGELLDAVYDMLCCLMKNRFSCPVSC